MSSTFQNILSMEWTHDYYTDENDVTNDFIVFPTAPTAELLARYRLFLKETRQGFVIACDDQTLPQIPSILGGRTLSFFIQLKNTGFMNFTELELWSSGKDIYYLQCEDVTNGVQGIHTMPLYPPVFTYSFTTPVNFEAGTHALLISVQGNTARDIANFPMASEAGDVLHASFDVTKYESGWYTVSTPGLIEPYLYISHEQQPKGGVFGIAHISFPYLEEFDPATYSALEYRFQFSARPVLWQYIVSLLAPPALAGEMSISGPHPFTAEVGNPPHPYNEGDVLRFTSDNMISYQEAPITGIDLEVGGISVYSHLPNPDTDHPVVWDDNNGVWVARIYVTL